MQLHTLVADCEPGLQAFRCVTKVCAADMPCAVMSSRSESLVSCRFKVAIADLVPGQETDMWVELEPSDHKKHIRNHSEFHENLDEKPKTSSSFQGEPRQRHRKRRNSDPAVVGSPAGHDAQLTGRAFQHDGMDQDDRDADLQDEGMHQEPGRDAFRPMHARQSRYEADGHASHGE